MSAAERGFLQRALELGRRGWGRVHPNPMVGCVLVRGDEVVGEGWHEEFGGPHAEIVALERAGEKASGATAFVSLEPCSHHGKTPPCTKALKDAGVVRVVFGALDPGKESGGGAAVLEAGGIKTLGPVLTPREALRENPGFFQDARDRPWVALKLAVSLDGKISSRAGARTPISGPEANVRVQWLRAGFDAMLVGTNTALADDPLLTVRGEIRPRVPPRRVILDAEGKVGGEARILSPDDGAALFITTSESPASWRAEMESRGASVVKACTEAQGRISLTDALRLLRELEVRTLLCEGGGTVGSRLLERRLVDRLYLIVAPRLVGGEGVPAFRWSEGARADDDAFGPPLGQWSLIEEPQRLGRDVWMVLEPEGE